MKESFQDLRYGWRMVQKTPGLSAVIVVMLALGIGANSAVFSIFSAILLRPLPYDHTDELVQLNGLRNQGSFLEQPFSYPNFADVRDSNQVFSQMGAYSGTSASLSGKDGAEQVITPVASAGFFETLGVKPVLGRTFEIADDQGQAPPVVMLTYGGWQRRFGGSSDVIGKTLVLDGVLNTIVGVLPQDFQFGPSQSGDVWQSLRVKSWKLRRNVFWLNPVARLKPGMSAQQAQAGISAIASQLEQKYPNDNAGVGVRLVPLEEQLIGPARPVLRLLMASVGFVLLITCANVAGLLVARSMQRQKEIAIRMAVGARRAEDRPAITYRKHLACTARRIGRDSGGDLVRSGDCWHDSKDGIGGHARTTGASRQRWSPGVFPRPLGVDRHRVWNGPSAANRQT